MKKLKVIVCKANRGVSAHLPEVDGYVIARDTVAKLKRDLREGLRFHIEGLYPEEHREWMDGEYEFEFVFRDIASLIEAYGDFINQSSLARITGINEGQMRKYVSGVKQPSKKTLERIETGVKQYASELQSVSFDFA
jgi:predicted RNase H-like HicB family nuclease